MELKTSISLRAWGTVQSPKLIFSSKGNEDGQLMQPHCATFNSNGKLIVTDTVRKIYNLHLIDDSKRITKE